MTHNLASLPIAQREAMNADLIACRMRSKCAGMGMAAWRQMCTTELAKMPPADAAAVREQLAKRAGR